MNAFKKFAALLLALMMILSLAACGSKSDDSAQGSSDGDASPDDTAKSKIEQIKEAGVLVMGTSADYPPNEFHTEVDGKDTIVGFDVAIAQYIADDLGVELKVVDMSFDNLCINLAKGDFDIVIAGMASTEERLKSVDFSDPYFKQQQAILDCLSRRGGAVLSAAALSEELRGQGSPVGLATIYRQLEKLEAAGVVHKVNTEDGAFYQYCGRENHDHRDCFLLRCERCGRIRHVFDAAVEFAKAGGYMDITTGASCCFDHPAEAVMAALDAGVDPTHITLSTDGHGSVPRFNDKGEMIGLGVGGVAGNLTEVKRLISEHKMPVEKAITFISSNVGQALGLAGQGVIEVGGCANACLFNDAMELTTVVSRNHVMMRHGEIVQKGTFEY